MALNSGIEEAKRAKVRNAAAIAIVNDSYRVEGKE